MDKQRLGGVGKLGKHQNDAIECQRNSDRPGKVSLFRVIQQIWVLTLDCQTGRGRLIFLETSLHSRPPPKINFLDLKFQTR